MGAKTAIFTPETFRFFRELGRNNRKEWMDRNRERYRAQVVGPFHALLEALAPLALKLNPDFDTSGRTGSNFSRINRDIRFAADKSPYRMQMYLMFADQRSKGWQGAQLYTGLSPDAVTAGFRIYSDYNSKESALAKLARPRALANPKWIERQQRRLGKKYDSYWYSVEKGEWTSHDGWPVRPEDWNRLKGWIVRRKMKPATAARANFPGEISKIFREVFALHQFCSSPKWKP
jgi:uncharacterized protein (TIGR02453 family)